MGDWSYAVFHPLFLSIDDSMYYCSTHMKVSNRLQTRFSLSLLLRCLRHMSLSCWRCTGGNRHLPKHPASSVLHKIKGELLTTKTLSVSTCSACICADLMALSRSRHTSYSARAWLSLIPL
ncbi:hypothetical protein KP509_31G041200 [Ceratopteris richardii]|uniref:Uncharacterized protein n=1 Tax=Ceratopteris richardii TaxID=49495 RepID=A0A8T2QYN7_CERRI|nr:hypothetical protein KP509_31G041200 [Ceratopteris richardii]